MLRYPGLTLQQVYFMISIGNLDLINSAVIARIPSDLNDATFLLRLPTLQRKLEHARLGRMLKNQHWASQRCAQPFAQILTQRDRSFKVWEAGLKLGGINNGLQGR